MRNFESERAAESVWECVSLSICEPLCVRLCVRMVVVSPKLTACVCRVALWSATCSRLKRWQRKRDSGEFFCRSAMQINLAKGGLPKHSAHFTQLFIQYTS